MTTSAAQLKDFRARVKDGQVSPGEAPVLTREAVTEPSVDAASRRVKFVISDATRDRVGDSLYPEGCDTKNYVKNPVMLFAHDSSALPIAKCVEGPAVEGGQLVATFEFLTEAENPFAELVFQQVQKGVLRAVSVGFLPKAGKMVWNDEVGGIDFVEWELLEVSVVPVPCNPNALAVDGKGLAELEALVKSLRSKATPAPEAEVKGGSDAPPATGSATDYQAFLDSLGSISREMAGHITSVAAMAKAIDGQIKTKATMLARMDAATRALSDAAATLASAASSSGKAAPGSEVKTVTLRLDTEAFVAEVKSLTDAIKKGGKGHLLSKRQYARAKAAIQTCSEMLADHHAAAGAPEGEPDGDEGGQDTDHDGDKAAPVDTPVPASLEEWKAQVKAMGLDPEVELQKLADAEMRKAQGFLD